MMSETRAAYELGFAAARLFSRWSDLTETEAYDLKLYQELFGEHPAFKLGSQSFWNRLDHDKYRPRVQLANSEFASGWRFHFAQWYLDRKKQREAEAESSTPLY